MARILTGIQSSGKPHLGNVLGAIEPAIKLSNEKKNESFFFIAGWSNPCRDIRWRPGATFNEARFDEKSLSGEWEIACWRCDLDGGFSLFKE